MISGLESMLVAVERDVAKYDIDYTTKLINLGLERKEEPLRQLDRIANQLTGLMREPLPTPIQDRLQNLLDTVYDWHTRICNA